jgi:beta propeller repeat protein
MLSRAFAGVVSAIFALSAVPFMASAVLPPPSSPVLGDDPVVVATGDQYEASVDGGVVVWTDESSAATTAANIVKKDLATGVQEMVYVDGDSYRPDISGDVVVWEDYSEDSDGNVYSKSLSTGVVSEVAASAGEQWNAAIDGDIVVWQTGYYNVGYDIEMMDISTGETQTVAAGDAWQRDPDVSGDIVVWEDNRLTGTADYDVFMYDIGTGVESQVCTSSGTQRHPSIGGDIVVWDDSRNGGYDIYMKDLSTGEESAVCTAAGDQQLPVASGNIIAWQDDRGSDTDVYAYDLRTGLEWQVTSGAWDQTLPATDGEIIAWVDERDSGATGEDIYYAAFDDKPPVTASDVKASYTGTATIELSADDGPFGSGVADTFFKIDGAQSTYAGPFDVTRPGKHSLRYRSVDIVGNVEAWNSEHVSVMATNTAYTAVEGATRYDTAVATSRKAFPKGASSVVIATGMNWPDALGGAALAKAMKGSILLTAPDALPSVVLAEIERLGATEAVILGGDGAVSSAVQDSLESELGDDKVSRIGGKDRYDTADRVAQAVADECGCSPAKVLVATGADFPDALGASPLAALGPWPIVLAPAGGGLTGGTKKTIDDIGASYGVILGGENAVSSAAMAQLEAMLGVGKVTRLAGETRFETAIACAEFGVAHGLFWDGVAISTGTNFPDAMAGGVLQGEAGSVMLLTLPDSLHPSVAETLEKQRDWIGAVTYLGGTAAVGQTVRDQVEQILK